MVNNIEPFEFIRKTNIDEHNAFGSKINEIVTVINDTDLDNIPTKFQQIETELGAVSGKTDQNTTDITAIETDITGIKADVATNESNISNLDTEVTKNTEDIAALKISVADNANMIQGLSGELPDTLVMSLTGDKEIVFTYNKEDGTYISSDPLAVPFVKTITLIPGSTDRTFKIQMTFYDGSELTTNDFVIPEGGGTTVSVSGVTIAQGSTSSYFKVQIQLSDGSTIDSNEYPFPGGVDAYTKAESDEKYATKTELGNYYTKTESDGKYQPIGDYETVNGAAGKYQPKGDYETVNGAANKYQPIGNYLTEVPIGGTSIGGVKNGGDVTIQSDGTMKVSSGSKQLVTSGDITQFVNVKSNNNIEITQDFEIEFIKCVKSSSSTSVNIIRTPVNKANYLIKSDNDSFSIKLVNIPFTNQACEILISDGVMTLSSFGTYYPSIIYTDTINVNGSTKAYYRLYK